MKKRYKTLNSKLRTPNSEWCCIGVPTFEVQSSEFRVQSSKLLLSALACLLISSCAVGSRPVSARVERGLQARSVGAEQIGLHLHGGGQGFSLNVFTADLASAPITLPMVRSVGGLPAVKVRLNDAPSITMIADTGAQLCVVEASRALAARAQVYAPSEQPFRVTGVGGEEKAWLARFDRLQLGSMELKSLVAVLRRSKTFYRIGGVPMRGVEVNLLGAPILGGFRYVTFDYPARRITFSPGTPYQPSAGARRIPLTVRENLFYIPLHIGTHTIEAMVDTGAKDQLFLHNDVAKTFDIAARSKALGTYRAVGLGGEIKGHQYRLPLALLGDVPFRDVTVDTSTGAWQARIGTDLLEKSRVTFDFAGGALWLE